MGGDSPQPQQTQKTETSNVPEWAKPFYQQQLQSAGKNIYNTDASGNVTGVKPLEAYTGERTAGFTPGQQQVHQNIAGLQSPGGFGSSQAGLQAGQNLGYGSAVSGLNQAMNYQPQTTTAQNVGTQQFTPYAAQQYMNPYQQAVTSGTIAQAQRAGDQQKANVAMQAAGRGTFGGARQALTAATNQDLLNRQLSDIQNKGGQEGYNTAFSQFTQDQARNLQAQQANQAANLTAQQQTQQGQQYAAGLGKDIYSTGLGAGIDSSKAQGALAAQQQTSNLERLKAQAGSAAEQQALQQQIDNINYQTAMEARDWEKKQLDWMNAQVHGTQGVSGQQTTYTSPANQTAQMAGLGISGLGAYLKS